MIRDGSGEREDCSPVHWAYSVHDDINSVYTYLHISAALSHTPGHVVMRLVCGKQSSEQVRDQVLTIIQLIASHSHRMYWHYCLRCSLSRSRAVMSRSHIHASTVPEICDIQR